ncbi:hypothetical protein DICPUDRAFT_96158 [Dictyostelium purpureum]|uniref:non-specific serine/threonine protein kinase n=1 Tax=Dictyostelium purpureum TaxID=5786 RepID=F1A5M5_DICPU|nr:uncharacterized protein DICPUDRAFT_96158 [Dictyostelium purpureum]EGC28506.1 hypothetical protein DICPUDRAFT_96158 [Dictyostelium purpureum]|eukprot:XP_003294969.1 hypothetical protein DICPUDRAFT_96158 [Dictyostelium purpureum]
MIYINRNKNHFTNNIKNKIEQDELSKYQQRYELSSSISSNKEINILDVVDLIKKDATTTAVTRPTHIVDEKKEEAHLSASLQSDLSTSESSNSEQNRNSFQRPLMVDIGLECKYRLQLEQNPKDFKALIKWGSLIYKNIKQQLGGKHVDVCLLDWNEELLPIPQNSQSNSTNTSTSPFSDSLQSYLLKEPLFDVCGKYQHSLQLSGGSNLLNIPFSTLLNFNLEEQYNLILNNQNCNNNNNNNNNNLSTSPSSQQILRSLSQLPAPPTPPSEDPNSPWSDPILWMKWGDCLFLLCTYLELPMYKATCEKYFKSIQLIFKQQLNNNFKNSYQLPIALRKWGIALSRYSRRMKSQFLMSEWTSEENIQVEELWKVLHAQSIQSLLMSNKLSPSLITQYHLAASYHRHSITLNQFGGKKETIYGLITTSCKIYYETLMESLQDDLPIKMQQDQLQLQQQQFLINTELTPQQKSQQQYFFQNEIFNDYFKSKVLENWGRALDVQLTIKLDEEETIEKEEEDLNAVDEYLTTLSRSIYRGINPSLEGAVSLCLNSTQAIQYKAINSISVLCRSKEITFFPIYNELKDQLIKVESFVSKRDDAESLLSQQKTLKSMPPKLQVYVRMSGLSEEEIMKNFEIAWNSIFFLTKDTIPNQPIPPNYYRSNKKNKHKQKLNQQLQLLSGGDDYDEDNNNNNNNKQPLLPSAHRTSKLDRGSFIITPYNTNSQPKYNTLKFSSGGNNFFKPSNLNISMNNNQISPTKNSSWKVTLPSKAPTRRATISLVSLNLEDEESFNSQINDNGNNNNRNKNNNNNNNNNNNSNNNDQNNIQLKPVSKYIPSSIVKTTVNPPPLSRCDESIFSSGSPLALFKDKIKLGTGAFGNVFYAVRKSDGKPVAIKVLMERTKKGSPIIPELYIHSACNHPNIVSYIESYLCKGHLWIIMEYCDGGTVRDLLQQDWKNHQSNQSSNNCVPLEETLIAYITEELLEGLVYLRSKGIIHRDIKSRNILLTRKGKVKIADFGLATTCSLGRGRTRMCGTMGRIAPEVIRREPYDTQADIYSLGCLLIEMAEGTVPYGKDSSLKALFYTAIHDYKLPNPKKYTKEFVDFLNLCLNSDPFQRPTPEMLLNHSFLSGADRGKSILLNRFKNQDNRKNLLLDNFVAF